MDNNKKKKSKTIKDLQSKNEVLEKKMKKLELIMNENLELNKETHKMMKTVKNYVLFERIFFLTKVILIFIPIILGFIYLPPFLKESLSSIQEFYQRMLELITDIERVNS